jgi:hypothetical protein
LEELLRLSCESTTGWGHFLTLMHPGVGHIIIA